jgi:hypothetical protein
MSRLRPTGLSLRGRPGRSWSASSSWIPMILIWSRCGAPLATDWAWPCRSARCATSQYVERAKTAYEHSWEIRRRFGYHEFEDRQRARKFRTFLYGRAWTHPEGRVALFNHAVAWLRRNRVLLPGASVLARQVSEARAVAERRLHTTVARAVRRADPGLSVALVSLLEVPEVPEGARFSELERLRRPPTRSTGTAMARALERVEEIAAFGLGGWICRGCQ